MEETEATKLFIGGISWETTDDTLREHFGKYGVVLGSVIAKDRVTLTPRGFAFVTFSESSAVERALRDSHEILGRQVEVKKAIPRSEQQQSQQQDHRGFSRNNRTNSSNSDQPRTKKIFVGGLSANLTQEEFRSYFEKFGRITDVVVMHDNLTRRPRGFGFISFESEDSVEEVMRRNFHDLNGKHVEVKRAVPKDGNSRNGYNGAAGRGADLNSFQQGGYPPYDARTGYFPPAYYPYGAAGGYLSGYTGFGYGYAPVVPRGLYPAMTNVGGNFLPYGTAVPVFPTYLNGAPGVTGMTTNGFNGVVGIGYSGKLAPPPYSGSGDTLRAAESIPSQTTSNNVDTNGRNNGAAGKRSQKGNDKSYTASNSN